MPKDKKGPSAQKVKRKNICKPSKNDNKFTKQTVYVMDSDEEEQARKDLIKCRKKDRIKYKGSALRERKDLIVGLRNDSNGRSCIKHGLIPCGETLQVGDHVIFRKETFRGKPAVGVSLFQEVDNKLVFVCKVGFIPAKDVHIEAVAMGFNNRRGVISDILDTQHCDDDASGFTEHYQGVAVFKFT